MLTNSNAPMRCRTIISLSDDWRWRLVVRCSVIASYTGLAPRTPRETLLIVAHGHAGEGLSTVTVPTYMLVGLQAFDSSLWVDLVFLNHCMDDRLAYNMRSRMLNHLPTPCDQRAVCNTIG